MAYKILVADDEAEIRQLLRLYLEKDGYEVIEAGDGDEALRICKEENVDMALLDIMMPGRSGYQVLQKCREFSNIPVIMISAKGQDADKILGLDLGADDYIAKPFNPLEAMARINSNMRRFYALGSRAQARTTITHKDLRLETEECLVYKKDQPIDLTSVEYRILKLFMENPGKVFTKQQIYEAGWGEEFVVADNNIMVCISKLRSKIDDADTEYIRSTNILMLQILLIFLAQRIALFMPLSSSGLVTEFLSAIFKASLVDDVADLAQKFNGVQVSGYILNVVFLLLITLLFDYVKLDSAGYSLHKSKTDICELARKCISALYADLEDKGMELEIEIPEEEILLDLDPTQMERAINNVLTNTIRHNSAGTHVTIQVHEDVDALRLQFSDDGAMIPRETALHLFEPFVQGDSTRSSKSGSGLGLSITRKIVEMHNGRIILYQYKDAEKYGKVKMFEIRLPKTAN